MKICSVSSSLPAKNLNFQKNGNVSLISNQNYLMTSPNNNSANNPKSSKNKIILEATLITAALAGAYFCGKPLIKKINKNSPIDLLKQEMSKYPKDVEYRKNILQDMGLNPTDYCNLRPIVGTEELKNLVTELSKDENAYAPGVKSFEPATGEAKFLNRENVKNFTYRANLHIHTVYSDGKLTIKDLLNQAVEYADKRALNKKNSGPFVIAITDHDCVQGNRDVVKAVLENPDKYKNLRIVLGIENSTTYENPDCLKQPISIHLLSYGINPFGTDIKTFLESPLAKNKENVKKAIDNVNNSDKFKGILESKNLKYDFDDMVKISPSIATSVKTCDYYLKDYLQFKFIYQTKIENNEQLAKFLQTNNIKLDDCDYAKPIEKIPQNLDYQHGQKYWEYYYEALQKHIITTAQEQKPDVAGLEKLFTPIKDDERDFLNRIEAETLNPDSNCHVAKIKHPSFDETVQTLSNFSDGVMGIAHPSVFFPINAAKDDTKMVEMYKDIYERFKNYGGDRAVFAEDNYQDYYPSKNLDMLKQLSEISSSYKLLKTGGLDTHSNCIFESK